MYGAIAIYIYTLFSAIQAELIIDSKAWGPGLTPQKFVMPARYMFLELSLNNSYNINYNENLIDFKATGIFLSGNRPCRIWANILNRKNGSYILRYKLFESCKSLQIEIKYKDKHLANSPYNITENVYHEKAYCPKEKLNDWLENVGCDKLPKQIKKDLNQFESIDWNQIRSQLIDRYDSPHSVSLCHYVVKDNSIYRKCYGKHVGFKMFMDNILLSLARKTYMPDLEFFVNLGDWPLIKSKEHLFPLFSWCGSENSYDIVMPSYDITESTMENMGRVMLDMLSVQGNVEFPWNERIPKAFWRGRDSNVHRLNLIDLANENPHLFNASITNFFFFRDKMEKYGSGSKHVSFYEFFNYKYQINIDGTVAAYRFPYLLGGGSLAFKQDSNYYEYFYSELNPNEHYIPIKTDLSDLVTKLQWAIDNDEKAKRIAENARHFANQHLLPENIFCYHGLLFNEFSKLIVSEIEILNDMEKVEQPADVYYCDKNVFNKDEL